MIVLTGKDLPDGTFELCAPWAERVGLDPVNLLAWVGLDPDRNHVMLLASPLDEGVTVFDQGRTFPLWAHALDLAQRRPDIVHDHPNTHGESAHHDGAP